MKKLLLLALLSSATVAAAPPAVYPGEELSESRFPIIIAEGDDCVFAWFYDDGTHKWVKDGFYGTGDDCKKARPAVMEALGLDLNDLPSWVLSAAVAARLMSLSHAEKDALYSAVFNLHPGDERFEEAKAAATTRDAGAKALYDAIPYPDTIPPSGLVTTSTVAYRREDKVGGNTLAIVGSVPIGATCNTAERIVTALGTYYALADRNQAVMTKAGNYTAPRPTTVWVDCTP